jgi:HAD superfamily hydrolase (TIGR01509 family)
VYREHYVRTAPSTTLLLPGVPEALARLQTAGVRMGVATSKRRSSAEPILAYLNIAQHFEVCIGPEDVSRPKPHPEPLHALMRRMGVADPAKFIYIGDTHFDAKAAQAAGVAFVGVTTGYASRSELEGCGAEIIVDTIADAVNCVLTGCIRTS